MLAPRLGSENVGQQGHSPACKRPRSIDAMALLKTTYGLSGPRSDYFAYLQDAGHGW